MSPRPARALVIGASGFLGSRLLALAPRDIEVTGTGNRKPVRPGNWKDARLDVTSSAAVRTFIEKERPGAVFYVAYDKADRAITVEGARTAARAAAAAGARFLFTSTDLVFDGRTGNYHEGLPAAPLTTYGQMKLEAEAAVKDAVPDAVVLRMSLLTGESGIMLRPAFECNAFVRGQPVDLYVDEWRSPLHVDDAAKAAWTLITGEAGGTYHLGGPDRLSRVEFGKVLCALYKFDPALIREVRRPDDRPRDTSLNSARLVALLGWAPRSLKALAEESPLAAAGV